MNFKDTAKKVTAAATMAGGTVMAATSGLLQDPAYPVQEALTAPDMKSAGVAALAAGVTAAVMGRRAHLDDAANNARR